MALCEARRTAHLELLADEVCDSQDYKNTPEEAVVLKRKTHQHCLKAWNRVWVSVLKEAEFEMNLFTKEKKKKTMAIAVKYK